MDPRKGADGVYSPPPPARDDMQLSNITGILQKKNNNSAMAFLSGAPLLRKILDPPMKGMINGGTVTPNAYLPGHI